jgi:formylglycine-generating enzyme
MDIPTLGGEDGDCKKANYNSCVGDTTQVGSYQSGKSVYDIYDLSGNVSEWVNDWYDDTYYQHSPPSNPLGSSSGTYRVLRGGSWSDRSGMYVYHIVYSANRDYNTPDYINDDVGFRCARDANP